jgi:solute carrier family 25 (mitochondrial carnitine/acylcarnitine transporter), member 20/29
MSAESKCEMPMTSVPVLSDWLADDLTLQYVDFSLVSAVVPLASALIELAPGAIGGFFNVFVGHPMDLIKVRQQSAPCVVTVSSSSRISPTVVVTGLASASSPSPNNVSTAGMLRSIIAQEGIRGLYRGVASPLLAVTPAFAISFWSCDLAKATMVDHQNSNQVQLQLLHPQRKCFTKDDLSIAQVSLAGAFSGVPLACVVGPSERIKCLMQVDRHRYSGFLDCAGQLYREGGLASIFRGTGSAVLRDVPGNAAYFGTYELCKRQLCALEQRETPSSQSILLSGGMAGVANWIVAIPFDTLKSRIQTAPVGRYTNYADVLRQTVQQEGFKALFRGLTPALLRAFPANAACLFGVETARSYLASLDR